MFRINKQQLKAFEENEVLLFVDKMLSHLRKACSSRLHAIIEPALRVMIREGIEDATQYGIIDEHDMRRYLEYVIIYGRDLDTNPKTAWVGEVLREKGISGTVKMDKIDAYEQFVASEGK